MNGNRLTRGQVREVDRVAIEEFGVPGVVLMENAARGACAVAMEMIGERGIGEAMILCGGGNNGGDGLAMARHLHNAGVEVVVGIYGDAEKYKGDALVNWKIVEAMGLRREKATGEWIKASARGLIVDAIFGTGLDRAPRAGFEEIVGAVEASGKAVLAVDVPSGLDCDTGRPLGPCIRAKRTVTFVAEKVGFGMPGAAEYTGRVSVVDIGAPKEILKRISSAGK